MKSIRFSPAVFAGVLAFGVPLAVYLAFPNKNLRYDAVAWALQINEGAPGGLFHPHHLIYTPLGSAFSNILSSLGINISTITLMQTVSSLTAATGLLLFFVILLRLSQKITTSLIFTFLLAFSIGLWKYAIEVDSDTFGLVFLIGGLLLIVNASLKDTYPKPGMLISLGVLSSLACLFQQMHILFVAAVCTFICITGRGLLPRLKMMAFYLAPFVLLVGGSYIAVGFVLNKLPDIASYYYWVTQYFHAGGWGYFAPQNFPLSVIGLQQSFFWVSFIADFLTAGNIDAKGIVLLSLFVAGVALLMILSTVTVWKFKDFYKLHGQLVIFLLVWILVYGMFISWWDPAHEEFWMYILPPIWLFLFLGFENWHVKKPNRKLVLLIALLCLLVSVNFVGNVLPNSDLENNENYHLVQKLHEQEITSKDLVLIYDPGPIELYYRLYFNSDLQVTSLREGKPSVDTTKQAIFEHLSAVIESTLDSGGKVLISDSEINPYAISRGITAMFRGKKNAERVAEHSEFYAQYQDRMVRLFSYQWRKQNTWMFEITPAPRGR